MMLNDVRLSLRSIRRRPGLSLTIIVMLAFGIGATTALFSLFHQILMKPLPVAEPQELVNLLSRGPKWGSRSCGFQGGCDSVFSYPMFRDLESRQTTFLAIAGHDLFSANLSYGEQTSAGAGVLVSQDYFRVLGVQPALGRLIGEGDEPRLGESAVVVLSYDYWQSRFGGDPDVVNQRLKVNGQSLTIIGVAPAGFSGTAIGFRPEVFVPLTLAWTVRPTAARNQEDRRAYWLYVFARLNPRVTVEQATASISGVYNGIIKEFDASWNRNMPDDEMDRFLNSGITLEPGARGQSTIPDAAGRPLTLLFGVTALVLLIVCVNIANLLLTRGAARSAEMAIRASLGARRPQLMSQLLMESATLAVIGGFLSLPVATAMLDLIVAILPAEVAAQLVIRLSPEAMAFAALASIGTVLLFGLFPAIRATRADLTLAIKGQASRSTEARGLIRFRGALAVAQIAFSMVLLVLAGLFTQSLMNIARVNLGLDVNPLVSFSVSPQLNGYGPERTTLVLDQIEEEISAIPGVSGVTSASVQIIAGDSAGNSISMEGIEGGAETTVYMNEVSPGFFDTFSIPLLAGRDFTDADTLNAPKVAIVNQSFARKFNIDGNAIGKRFSGYPYDNVREVEAEIVGVVADAAYENVKGKLSAQYFLPRRQNEDFGSASFYVRSVIDPDSMLRAIPAAVARVDPNLPVNSLITMRRQIRDNVYLDLLVATLSAAFAVLATLLAAIGLYGVLAYNVAQRTRELGLRLALGAEPARLRAMVLRQVGLMALAGGGIGLGAALALGRAAEALLFGLSGRDASVLATAIVVLAIVVLAAGYLPARRASNVAPMNALRYE
jgi:predicted permease